jgi:hypothetical protein
MVYLISKTELAKPKPVIMVLLLSLLLLADAYGQANSGWKRGNNWFISGSTGMAILAGEATKGFELLPNEFIHSPGFAFNFDIGRTFGNQWESLLRLNAYTLFGKSSRPDFSAVGYQSSLPGQLDQLPVEYITPNSSASIILRYMFKDNSRGQSRKARFHPFAEAGLGIHSFTSELRYQIAPFNEESPVISKIKDGDTPVGVAVITTGIGAKTGAPDRWNLVFLWNAELVDYDALDAVHNFSNGSRNHSRAVILKLTAGLTIPFGGNKPTDNYLPFSRW